jgi:N-acetylneuraminic acid mutarotase
MRPLFLSAIFLCAITCIQAQPDSWKQKKSLTFQPELLGGAVSFIIKSKVYVVGGSSSAFTSKETWEWDPVTNFWLQKASFPGAGRELAAAFSIDNKGYLGSGSTYDTGYHALNDFWEYDAATDRWARKADIPGEGRIFASGFSLHGKGYIVGGKRLFGSSFNESFQYDPVTDTWARKSDYPGLSSRVSMLINNKVYVGRSDFYVYEPISDTWNRKADYPGSRAADNGFAIGNKGYLISTVVNWSDPKESWQYDPEVNSWSRQPDFPGKQKQWAISFSLGGKGFIIGGTGESVLGSKEIWEYDPVISNWTFKGNVQYMNRTRAIAFSIGSKGYVGLGKDGGTDLKKDVWEYDPETDSWSQKADFGGKERMEAVAFSIGNKAYVALGRDSLDVYKKDLWEYDASLNQWTQRADYPGAGGYISLSFPSKAYIIGRETWQYDGISDQWSQKADYPGFNMPSFGFAISNNGYVASMYGERDPFEYGRDIKTEVWELNSEGNWSRKADFPGIARDRAVTFAIGAKGYVTTGFNRVTIFRWTFGNIFL